MIRNLTLTQRAMLTFAGNLVVQLAEFLTGFFVSPVIMRGLGTELFGIWGILQQTNGYLSTTDLRAPAALRFLLTLRQHDEDIAAKQRLIGALFTIWAVSLPLTAIIGAIVVWKTPQLIHSSGPQVAAAQVALLLLLVNSIIDRILAVPLHVLRAQNMDYIGVSVNTFTVISGSLLSGLAVWLGWGLVGLAAAITTNTILVSLGRFWVARRAIPWLAIKKPHQNELLQFLKTSLWLFFAGAAQLMVYSTDVVLVGLLMGSAVSGIYVATGVGMRMVGEPIYQIVSAGNAGLQGICGQNDWQRVARVRKEMYFILLFFMTILGTGVIALNRPFLSIWSDPMFYGGQTLTVVLVAAQVTLYLSRIDMLITDAMLFLKQKTWASFAAGLTVILSGLFLLPRLGAMGMALALLAGNLLLLVVSWFLIHQRMGWTGSRLLIDLLRPLTVMLICFALAYWAQNWITASNWLELISHATAVGGLTLACAMLLSLPSEIRASMVERLRHSLKLRRSDQ